ncbi:hypothetical protein BgAZ_109000 [Babesia gibsoni]|uniref:Uncharacterized protein n=1 Tax=Babesia gibsoni TaxID=33632 RepID=A0AAD8PGM7_BABGI|nr:hypothetical protein BgAZ_109000 [Babesia gibsoni]
MSRSKRKDLGLSGREYEEAIILERIFTLTKHNRCVTCLVRKSTHVDPERLNLLCASCASRRPYKIQIGRDHLSMHILEKLEAIYGRNSSRKSYSTSKTVKKSSHRHGQRSYSNSSSSSVSVEVRKSSHSRKHRSPSYDSPSPHTSRKSKGNHRSHTRQSSVSSISSYEASQYRRGEKNVDEGRTSRSRTNRNKLEDHDERKSRREEVQFHDQSHGHSGNRDRHINGYSSGVISAYPTRDPYGYEIPVNHEMPGMSSMMARERRGQTVTPTYTNNGWPVVQSTKGTEYDSVVQHNGRMYPGATNGNHPAIRQNHMEITVPLRKKDANNVPRTHSTNPFANSESRMNTNPMSKPMFDRDDYRFNMSNMRSALNDTTDLQKYGAAAMQSNYDAPARGNVRPIANYGSVYERRVPR